MVEDSFEKLMKFIDRNFIKIILTLIVSGIAFSAFVGVLTYIMLESANG